VTFNINKHLTSLQRNAKTTNRQNRQKKQRK